MIIRYCKNLLKLEHRGFYLFMIMFELWTRRHDVHLNSGMKRVDQIQGVTNVGGVANVSIT